MNSTKAPLPSITDGKDLGPKVRASDYSYVDPQLNSYGVGGLKTKKTRPGVSYEQIKTSQAGLSQGNVDVGTYIRTINQNSQSALQFDPNLNTGKNVGKNAVPSRTVIMAEQQGLPMQPSQLKRREGYWGNAVQAQPLR